MDRPSLPQIRRVAALGAVLASTLSLFLAPTAGAHHYSDRFGSDIQALVGPVLGFGENGDLYSCNLNVNSHTPHLPANRRLIGYSGAVKCDHGDVTIWVQGRLTAPDDRIVVAEAPALGPYVGAELHAGGYYYRPSENHLQRTAMTATIELPGNGKWYSLPPQCRGTNTATATCAFAAAPFLFQPDAGEGERDIGIVECPQTPSGTSPVRAARASTTVRAASVSTMRSGQSFTVAEVGDAALLARNRARRMGDLRELIRPRLRSIGAGFAAARGFTTLAAGATARDGVAFGTSRLRVTPTGAGDQRGRIVNGNVRYASAANGGDIIVRPAAAGAFVSTTGDTQTFEVAQEGGLELLELAEGVVALVQPLDAVGTPPERARSLDGFDIRDPRDHGALADAAVRAALQAGVRPLLVFVPLGNSRLSVAGDRLDLAAGAGSGARTASTTALTMAVADPSDFVDDGDGADQGTACHRAEYDEELPAATRASGSAAAAIPGIKCFGNARPVRGTGAGWMEAVGSLACVDRRSRTLSIRTCIAVKRWGIWILSAYRDFTYPTSPNSAFGVFVGQTHRAHCISGDHKYRTHVHTSVNGRKTHGYQSGNFRIKRCK